MDSMKDFEIYVPTEAEVKTVLLKNLPKSVLRQIGHTVGISSRDLTSSPGGTYISPVVLQKKGSPIMSQDNKGKLKIPSRKQLRAQKHLSVSFVTSNRTALKVLEDLLPGIQPSNHSDTSPVPPCGSIPLISQDAVIIYREKIYLSLKRKPMGSQRQIPHDTNTDVPAPPIEISSASDCDSQEETPQFRETSPEPPKAELQKKEVKEQSLKRRCQVKLIRIPRKTLNRLLAKTLTDSVSQRECYGTHEESLEKHKTKENLAQCEDDGLAADSQPGSDMEQMDVLVSESDGAHPGEESLENHKTKNYLTQYEDDGLATDSQPTSDMEQVDTLVSESDGANPGHVLMPFRQHQDVEKVGQDFSREPVDYNQLAQEEKILQMRGKLAKLDNKLNWQN